MSSPDSRPQRVRPPKPCIGCAQRGRLTRVTDGGSWCPECKPSKAQAYRHPDYVDMQRRLRAATRAGITVPCTIRGPHCTGTATQVDHITALAHGGRATRDNLCYACAPCNQGKNAGGHDG